MPSKNELNDKIRLGLNRVGEINNQGFMKAVDDIAKDLGIGSSTLRSWATKPSKRTRNDEDIARFARACLKRADSLDKKWLEDLFQANGTRFEMLPDPLKRDLIDVLKSREVIKGTGINNIVLKYQAAVEKWSQSYEMFGNRIGRIGFRGSVHTSLERLFQNVIPFANSVPRDDDQPFEDAETLISEKRIQAFVTSAPGGGKTVLLHYLSWILSVQKHGPLPVPLDWTFAENVDDVVALIRKSIKNIFPHNLLALTDDEINELANFLNLQLSEGLAIGLIDNWNASPTSKALLNDCFNNWERVIVFARYTPAIFSPLVKLYKLTILYMENARQFVLKWPEITGNPIDVYRVWDVIQNMPENNMLYLSPLFLDLFCYRAFIASAYGEFSFWELIYWVVDEMIGKEVGAGSIYPRFDLALAELAFSKIIAYQGDEEITREIYLSAKVDMEWRIKFGAEGQNLFDVAYTKGFLRDISNKQVIRFPHPAIEAYFAAKAWILKDNFIKSISTFKRSPFLCDLMVAAATILEKQNEINLLVSFIKAIWLPLEGKSNKEDFILAWNCYSTLAIETKEKINASGIGDEIEDYILHTIIDGRKDNKPSIQITWYQNRVTKRMKQNIISIILNKKRNYHERYYAMNLVKSFLGKEDIAWLIGIVRDPEENNNVQVSAINLLGKVKDPTAVDALSWIISHTNHKNYAYSALFTHNSIGAVNAITSHSKEFQDLDFSGFTNPELVPLFRKILSENAQPNPSVLEALIKIHTREAIDLLSKYLDCPLLCEDKRIGGDFHKYVSEKVVWLLTESNTPIAYEALLSFIESKTELLNTKCMAIIAVAETYQLVDSYRLLKVLLEDPIWIALPLSENDPFEEFTQTFGMLPSESNSEERCGQVTPLANTCDESKSPDKGDKAGVFSSDRSFYDYSWSAIRVRYNIIENGNWSRNPENLSLLRNALKRTENLELAHALKQAIQKFNEILY